MSPDDRWEDEDWDDEELARELLDDEDLALIQESTDGEALGAAS